MLRKKLRYVLSVFSIVTTCVVFATALFTTVIDPVEVIPAMVMWQVPAVSLLCALGCLIYPWKPVRKWKMGVLVLLHYLYINLVVLGAGYLFGWYDIAHLWSVIAMVVSIAVIYGLVSVISFTKASRNAKQMNEKLEEYQREREGN